MSSKPVLFAVQAPEMSQALLMEGNDLQSERLISNFAKMHMARHFDVMLDNFTVEIVPDDTPDGFSLF